jgi:hypothetical protein
VAGDFDQSAKYTFSKIEGFGLKCNSAYLCARAKRLKKHLLRINPYFTLESGMDWALTFAASVLAG